MVPGVIGRIGWDRFDRLHLRFSSTQYRRLLRRMVIQAHHVDHFGYEEGSLGPGRGQPVEVIEVEAEIAQRSAARLPARSAPAPAAPRAACRPRFRPPPPPALVDPPPPLPEPPARRGRSDASDYAADGEGPACWASAFMKALTNASTCASDGPEPGPAFVW